jgi:3-isopropylmalate/(R)-2-methylmalate dehydratase small subunit
MLADLTGRARRFGDNVNTDYIITSTRKRDSIDASVLARYLFETLDPAFAASVQPGDLIVAGKNFGCGSAMEVAATAMLAAGIPAVLARSFSRSFYRNAVNNGLLPIVCDTSRISEGDRLTIHLGVSAVEIFTGAERILGENLPSFMLEIVEAGGLVGYVRARAGLPAHFRV